ncbi:hypothetical protein D3C87_1146400 [compost metagenome]
MIVTRNRERFLSLRLADDVIIKVSFDIRWFWNFESPFYRRFSVFFLIDDVVTKIDTLVTDVNSGTRDQFFNFFLAFATEAASQCSVCVFSCHQSALTLISLLYEILQRDQAIRTL